MQTVYGCQHVQSSDELSDGTAYLHRYTTTAPGAPFRGLVKGWSPSRSLVDGPVVIAAVQCATRLLLCTTVVVLPTTRIEDAASTNSARKCVQHAVFRGKTEAKLYTECPAGHSSLVSLPKLTLIRRIDPQLGATRVTV